MLNFTKMNFAPVMHHPEPKTMKVFDFSEGYDPMYIRSFEWGIGKYNENRCNMYTTSQYENKRTIHMGIDIWTKAGASVFSFYEGVVSYMRDNDKDGDYGPTIILEYTINKNNLYALYGHLSRSSLQQVFLGQYIQKGQKIGKLGKEEVNGGWAPHLHFQLSVEDPGQADMPGVVAAEDHEQALITYPDPRLILGNLY